MRACRAISRFGLDGDTARRAFDHYNVKCVPPWVREDEIAHKISEGKKLADRDGEFGAWIERGGESWSLADGDADLSGILGSEQRSHEPEAPDPPADRLTWKPFPVDALPDPLRRFVALGAAAIGCDPSFIALPLLVALAAAIGNTRRLFLKPGWYAPAILGGQSLAKAEPARRRLSGW